jgi:hypothetical protein
VAVALIFIVVQPVMSGTVHVVPVKPLAQMQVQVLSVRILVPPFAHVSSCRHCDSEDAAAAAVVFLLNTRSSSGTITAVAMIMRVTRTMQTKTHTGIPQHRRRFLRSGEFPGVRPSVEGLYGDSHVDGRGVLSREN